MHDTNRIFRILKLIEEIWIRCPDMRLGQILSNFAGFERDPFYYEDDNTEELLKENLRKMIKEAHKNNANLRI